MTIQQTAESYIIADAICREKSITLDEALSKCRKKHIVIVRQYIHYFLRKKLKDSIRLIDIGVNFGMKDHTTVLNSIRSIESRMLYKEFDIEVKYLSDRIDEALQEYRITEMSDIDIFIQNMERLVIPSSLNGKSKRTKELIDEVIKFVTA